MTIKRLVLIVLTIFAIARIGLSLVESWGQPQIQTNLELRQTNLVLHGWEWQNTNPDSATSEQSNQESKVDWTAARNALIGAEPFQSAQKQYETARQLAQTNQSKVLTKLQKFSIGKVTTPNDRAQSQSPVSPLTQNSYPSEQQQLQQSLSDIEQLIAKLDLRIGILQAQQGKTDAAIQTWDAQTYPNGLLETAGVLMGLWSDPPLVIPDAEQTIEQNLDNWFRYRALSQLYQVQQRQSDLLSLQTQEQETAEQAIVKLFVIAVIPGFNTLLGLVILVCLVGQLLFQGQQSLLATNHNLPWKTAWDGEIIWQVLIFGFFAIGQLLLPLLIGLSLGIVGINPANFTVQMSAFYVLLTYLIMAFGGLLVMYLSIKPFLPLPQDWFRFKWRSNWIVWGVGGYLIALPLVIVVSLINQQLWQGNGGSNPLLPLALEGQDSIALTIFFLTAAVAAPVFEEIIFRGFLLPSLTRYLPVWGAIALSSLIFAIAHLSLSEVLPLATLGIVLGFVYTRSRNLLAPMLLHSLWNSGTLLSLFVLGSS
ncbi:MAG: CPBP family intramembrane metalloprotease [Moorea sp. SIO1G6]|uniref:Type II CAAX endopeptidase family protein n=2 Tax=Moorena producens TaxID=1155739 RepID=A0A1D9G6J4_MOOP1|nr:MULTISPECIES: type II CAAX endopeptidase family protein [Moorena]AOY83105.1 type II CAAX endopeptidase family protein [Moorena producens JHB]NET64799.1 CPBP family intramembrane metalloprotease [Moorena sp. SIO1G6]